MIRNEEPNPHAKKEKDIIRQSQLRLAHEMEPGSLNSKGSLRAFDVFHCRHTIFHLDSSSERFAGDVLKTRESESDGGRLQGQPVVNIGW